MCIVKIGSNKGFIKVSIVFLERVNESFFITAMILLHLLILLLMCLLKPSLEFKGKQFLQNFFCQLSYDQSFLVTQEIIQKIHVSYGYLNSFAEKTCYTFQIRLGFLLSKKV